MPAENLKGYERISKGSGYSYQYRSNSTLPWNNGFASQTDTSSLSSQTHPGPPYRTGGPFYLWKEYTEFGRQYISNPTYRGFVTGGNLTGVAAIADTGSATDAQLDTFGATAISRVSPNNPAFSLATFLGEAREGVPHLIGSSFQRDKVDFLRNSGSEYLNVEFGWLPLVSDVQNFAHAVKSSKKILDQYRRDSGHRIRRRYYEPPTVTESVFTGSGFLYPVVANYLGVGTSTKTTLRERWFSGAFKYHIPTGDSQYAKFRRFEIYANHLLGTRLTPAVLWELSPWSWAVDWFTNSGDVINNITNLGSDGMVLEYGFSMDSRVNEHLTVQTGTTTEVQGRPFFRKNVKVFKSRRPAHPYGFGVDNTSLSARQLAVLAALGLSRS